MTLKIDAYTATAPALPVRAVNAARDATAPASMTRPPARREDSVALTVDAQLLQQVQQQAREHSGVDDQKVAEIRRELAEGRYTVDAQAVAARLMGAGTPH